MAKPASTLPGGRGLDLAASGLQCATLAEDVRRVALLCLGDYARSRPARARLVDPDDLVQDVYRRILRRNPCESAWDPQRGSWTTTSTASPGAR